MTLHMSSKLLCIETSWFMAIFSWYLSPVRALGIMPLGSFVDFSTIYIHSLLVYLTSLTYFLFGRPFVKWFALCYQTVVCPVCPVCPVLTVTLVYCGQTVGWIKMKLDMQVGLGPGHIVLDGDPATPPPKWQSPPIFRPYLLWPNGCMD